VKQNETTFKSRTLSVMLGYCSNNQMIANKMFLMW